MNRMDPPPPENTIIVTNEWMWYVGSYARKRSETGNRASVGGVDPTECSTLKRTHGNILASVKETLTYRYKIAVSQYYG